MCSIVGVLSSPQLIAEEEERLMALKREANELYKQALKSDDPRAMIHYQLKMKVLTEKIEENAFKAADLLRALSTK